MIGPDFEAVLADAQAGAEWAVAVLWRDLQPSVLRYFRAVEPQAADDLASEVWLEVARSLARFQGGEGDFRAWLFTIARHRLIDWRRKTARRRTAPVAWLPDCPSGEDPETDALDGLSTGSALALVGELPGDQAEVILLRVLAGLDVDRVAGIVGKRPGNVRVLQHRGLRTLALRLADSRQPEAAL
jgi:RNA polymerase sigma-70 factor (ECF subfamily)